MRRLIILVAAIAVAASWGSPGVHAASYEWGIRYLNYGSCCLGDSLNGTKASIEVNYFNPLTNQCLSAQSYGVGFNNTDDLIVVDLLRCGSSTGIDGTCSESNNFVRAVEVLINGIYHCYEHGAASWGTNYTMDVLNEYQSLWWAHINGTAYENETFSTGTAEAIQEGIEDGQTTSNIFCSGWSAASVFAQTSAWQRFEINVSWKTVQSSRSQSGCFTLSGGPPGAFSIQH